MITEAPATIEAYARLDAESREPLALPTREEVENGKPCEKFAITDEGKANWLLAKLANLDAEAARINAQADQRTAELRADRERLMGRFGSELEAFARAEADRRRRRTITLAQGSLCLRTVPAKLVIADGEAAFVNARVACPAAIVETTTVTLDKAAYLAYAESTGDLTGLEQLPSRESFAVKFPTSGKEAPGGTE